MRIATFILGVVFSVLMLLLTVALLGLLGLSVAILSRGLQSSDGAYQFTLAALSTLCAVVGMAFTLEAPLVSTAAYLIGAFLALYVRLDGLVVMIYPLVGQIALAALAFATYYRQSSVKLK